MSIFHSKWGKKLLSTVTAPPTTPNTTPRATNAWLKSLSTLMFWTPLFFFKNIIEGNR